MTRFIVWFVIIAALATGGYFGYQWYQRDVAGPATPTYRTAAVAKGDVIASISSTGTVVPEDVVDIGAQVNGLIATFGNGTDGKPLDYRSTVLENQVLATIDDAIYKAQVASDEASLKQAEAAVLVAQAQREQAVTKLDQAQRDWTRTQKLGESKALSQADYDASKSTYEQAVSSLKLAEAQINQATSQVAIAEAALQRSRRNLFYCTIKSPVNGVIIDRRVDIGQTVVSSLNAPSLFLIARDLSRMQVLVQVNEADIGSVKPGSHVTFTTDAFPNDTFTGEVRKVRLNATMTQNVVTYTVEVVTDNSSLKLLPYLTANVRFILDERHDVLTVPNSALRWAPTTEPGSTAADASDRPGTSAPSTPGAPRTQGRRSGQATPDAGAATPAPGAAAPTAAPTSTDAPAPTAKSPRGKRTAGRIYVLRAGQLTPIRVRIGLTDGSVTEVSGEGLEEGDQVVIGEVSAAAASAAASAGTNPFAPPVMRPPGGGNRGGGGR